MATPSPIATAADYADAMLAARRWKNALFLFLLLVIVAQVAVFLVLRRSPELFTVASGTASTAASQPATGNTEKLARLLEYVTALADFFGIVLALVLSFVLLLLVKIMLVGRLIGVSRVTSAYLWCLLLIVLLFPWQSILLSPLTSRASAEGVPDLQYKVPGVLYTWGEVTHPTVGAQFSTNSANWTFVVLKWARYVGWPAVALILLLTVQAKSSRGMRLALGEVEYDVNEGTPGV